MEKLILECVVRSVLIAVATAIALYLLRVRAARVRHAVWAGVVVLMLALPVWTAFGPKAVLRVLKPAPVVAAGDASVVMTMDDSATASVVVPHKSWSAVDYLMGIYFVGLGILLTRLAIGTVRSRRLTSESCMSPVTVGALRPVVILPDGWTEWPSAQLSAVLAHEGEHAKWRDPLVQWVALLNRAVFWFHPLAWWLSRRLSALAEEACDDAVLAGGHDAEVYTECLLGLARSVRESGARVSAVSSLPFTTAMPGAYLPQRIRRIVAGGPVQRLSRGRVVLVAAAFIAVAGVFTTLAVGYEPAADAPVAAPVLAATEVAGPVAVPAVRIVRKKPVLMQIAQNQVATAQSLSGVVMDPAGARVANAPVTLVNSDTKVSVASATTNAVGQYTFSNIGPGNYDVTVKTPGFKSLVQAGVRVAAGEAHDAGTMSLQLGSVAESVSVVGSRSAPVTPAGTIGNPVGDVTTLTPKAAAPIGIPLDQRQFVAQFPRGASPVRRQNPPGVVKIGGNVIAASLINPVKPVYPAELQRAGITGTVRLEALISKDGIAAGLQVISSPDAGLTQAALDAVKQWRYKPTMLNGEAVEVQTAIDVNFSLSD